MTKYRIPNAANREHVEAQKKLSEQLEREFSEDMRHVLSDGRGRRLMFRIIHELCRVNTDPFNHSGSITARNCGILWVGKKLESASAGADIEKHQLMMRENWAHLRDSLDQATKEMKENSDE